MRSSMAFALSARDAFEVLALHEYCVRHDLTFLSGSFRAARMESITSAAGRILLLTQER
jgi:hypothetical protein